MESNPVLHLEPLASHNIFRVNVAQYKHWGKCPPPPTYRNQERGGETGFGNHPTPVSPGQNRDPECEEIAHRSMDLSFVGDALFDWGTTAIWTPAEGLKEESVGGNGKPVPTSRPY